MREAQLGSKRVPFPGAELAELDDSSGCDATTLRARFDRDGYLFLRRQLPRDEVLAARARTLARFDHQSSIAELRRWARRDEGVRAVVEHPALFELTADILGTSTMTYSFKWMRVVRKAVGTGAHCDVVYMGRGSPNVRTVWIPFGDVPVEQGTLAVCEGSHRLEAFRRLHETYGRLDVDRDRIADTGWLTDEPLELEGTWRTADFEAGDVIVFGMRTFHAATANTTDELRVSCDVRFQPESEAADERWVGDEPIGHTAFGVASAGSTTVAELRRKWAL